MKNRSIFSLVIAAVVIIVLASILYLILSKVVGADSFYNLYEKSQPFDFGSGFGSKKIVISGTSNQAKIIAFSSPYKSCSVGLTGFEKDIKIKGTLDLPSGIKAVSVVGTAGAHAENIQIFRLKSDGCLEAVPFAKDELLAYNIYSDEPNFIIQDLGQDGVTDISSEYRDYDQDPLINGNRDVYIYSPAIGYYVFDRSEPFQYQN